MITYDDCNANLHQVVLPYADIPGFPVSTAPGHQVHGGGGGVDGVAEVANVGHLGGVGGVGDVGDVGCVGDICNCGVDVADVIDIFGCGVAFSTRAN